MLHKIRSWLETWRKKAEYKRYVKARDNQDIRTAAYIMDLQRRMDDAESGEMVEVDGSIIKPEDMIIEDGRIVAYKGFYL